MNNSRKIRVLHVLKSSIYSGAENVAITIIKKLQEYYDFAYVSTDGEIRLALEQERIKHFLVPRFSRKCVKQIIELFKPDIVHAHDFMATVICSCVRKRFYLISHLHYDPPWVRKWNVKTAAYILIAGRISKILAVSAKSYENMIFAYILQNKCEVVGNPVDIELIRKKAEEHPLIETYDLLFVGRLVEQKNPQRFLSIVYKLKKAHIDLKCAMLGAGELRLECEKLIQQYGLQESVQMLGFQENPYIFMKASKILCVTSKWEGYGLVVVEANSVGTPVLCTRTAGTEEVLGNMAWELCESDDDFVQKIQQTLLDAGQYEQWKKETIQRAEKFETIDVYVEKINRLYQDMLRG